jgi:hypothetical protein
VNRPVAHKELNMLHRVRWLLARRSTSAWTTLRLAPALIVGIGACAKQVPTDPSTGVLIQVRRGPIAPVQQDSVDNTAPVTGATVVLVDGSGAQVASATTDTSGTARVLAFPGAYQVDVQTCPGAMRTPQPAAVTVAEGSFAPAQLVCDTGIR